MENGIQQELIDALGGAHAMEKQSLTTLKDLGGRVSALVLGAGVAVA